MSQVGRPSQKSQKSRKGKRAWRKNIDIDDVEEAIEAKREEIRVLGVEASELSSKELFQIDVSGDQTLVKGLEIKSLKADEIIANKSKVQGVKNDRVGAQDRKKFQGVSSKEAHRLMKMAGRVQGVTTSQGIVEKHGLNVRDADYDAWDPVKNTEEEKVPEILKKKSITSYTKATVAPTTLKEPSITVKEVEVLPHAGKSYNPSLTSWKDLISQEYFKEKTKEDQRLALQEHQEHIQKLIDEIDEVEESESDPEEEDLTGSVSVNAPVRNKKKTRAQRNRQKRYIESQKLEHELKEIKQRIKELKSLDSVSQEVLEKEKKIVERQEAKKSRKRSSRKLGTKYHVIEDALEVKLSDELSDSLRKLKPEGNLLYDQMRVLQSKGKIETRLPVNKKRRYTPKVTEKWSYKDFK